MKLRTWLNIPDQKPKPDGGFYVHENADVFGSWVYHCHILRHEDRGMMMMVNVKPKNPPNRNGDDAEEQAQVSEEEFQRRASRLRKRAAARKRKKAEQ